MDRPPALPRTAQNAPPHAASLERLTARLVDSLRTRPGHALIVGQTSLDASEFFRGAAKQVKVHRSLTVDGRSIDPDAVPLALWGDDEDETLAPRSVMGRNVFAAARAAQLPIIVAVSHADAAEVRQLERLRQLLECVPDALETLRIVLLGTPRLAQTLTQPEARALATRIVTTVHVPAATPDVPTVPATHIRLPSRRPRRRGLRAALGIAAIVALAVIGALPRRSSEPPDVPVAIPSPGSVADAKPAEVVAARADAPDDAGGPRAEAAPAVVNAAVAPAPEPGTAIAAPAPAPAPNAAAVAAVPRDTVPAPQPAAAPLPSIALQVGAFRRPENAAALERRLATRFPHVEVVPFLRDGVTYHRVRVGGFATDTERAAAARGLRADGYAALPVR